MPLLDPKEVRAWIKDVGGPIAFAAFLAWFLVRTWDQTREDRLTDVKSHQTEIQKIVDAFRDCCERQTDGKQTRLRVKDN